MSLPDPRRLRLDAANTCRPPSTSGKCIGCGRCYKVCSRDVMHLHGVDERRRRCWARSTEDDDDDFDGELNRKIMIVDNAGACVGCGACSRVCPKDCRTHVAAR